MTALPTTLLIGLLAALAEIGGCFAVWGVVHLHRSPWWLLPAAASLAAFAYLTTQFDAAFAGRAYAAYGGIYIATAIAWLLLVEGRHPGSLGRHRGRALAGRSRYHPIWPPLRHHRT